MVNTRFSIMGWLRAGAGFLTLTLALPGTATAIVVAVSPVGDWRGHQSRPPGEACLPPGSITRLRQPDLWESCRWPIGGAVGCCLVQMALVAGLVVNRAKRRQKEAEANLMADISLKFVNLPASEVDRQIEDAQQRICEVLGLDLSALWQWSIETPRIVTMTHLYRPLGGPPLPEPMYAHEHFPWCQQQLEAGRMVRVSSLEDLPAEAARDQDVWRHLGIKSTVTFPLSPGGGPVLGALSFNTMRQERTWPEPLMIRLQLLAQMFTNALARKRAEQALSESEERMTLAAEAAEVGVWAWSLARNEVWGTERWRHLYGFVPGEHVSFEKVIRRIHPDDRETVEREVRHAVVSGTEYAGEFRLVLPDDAQRWIASRGRMHAESNEVSVRMLGAAIDITVRKRTEAALRTSEARLAAGTELANLGYYEVDFGEGSCFIDERFEGICGIPAGQQQGLQSLEFWMQSLHPDDRQHVLDERQKMHDGRLDRLSMEYRYLHPADGQKWIHHVARVATRNATGTSVRTYGVVRDIPQRRLAERETMELRSNLAHAGRVTMLGQLASALAHELSQPLGAILRNAEAAEIMLRAPSPDLDELRAIVTDILRDDQRAGHVIERLRSLLKKGTLDLQPVDLRGVIMEVLSLVHADAVARQVRFVACLPPDLLMVSGDRVHLLQVLLNLLVNAMDALEACASDQRSIHVSAHRVDPVTVEVRVVDSGPGIPGDSLNQLFEPFFTTKSNGMGMGLPVSQTIIAAHKGRLWAENGPDGGACFCFTLPVAGGESCVQDAIDP